MIYEIEYVDSPPNTLEELVHSSESLNLPKCCFVFFHVDSKLLLTDYLYCKRIEKIYGININWVDFSQITTSVDWFDGDSTIKISETKEEILTLLKDKWKENCKKYLEKRNA